MDELAAPVEDADLAARTGRSVPATAFLGAPRCLPPKNTQVELAACRR